MINKLAIRKTILLVSGLTFTMGLVGCGVSQKQLRTVNDLLEASKSADCGTIHRYLDMIQVEVKKKIK